MTRVLQTLPAAVLVMLAHSAAAQQPPRPMEPPRAVTLSLTEYNRLIDLARRPPATPAVAPVASVLASADLRVRVERETAHGVFTLAGTILRAGVSRVKLLAGTTLVDATVSGRPLPLLADGTAHTALLTGPGPFSLSLEWGAPLTFAPGRASFVLPVPPSGTSRATIDLPGDQADVHLSHGLITRRSVTAGRTIVEATLDPGSSTEVWWSMRDSAPTSAARDVRTLADVMSLITLDDSDVRLVTLIDLSVVQGEPRTIEVRLPAGYEVTSISGSTLVASDPGERSVVLTVDPAARRHQFLLSLERQHDDGSFRLDTDVVTLPGAQRERGEIAVEGVGTLELVAAEREGMHRVDVRELNDALHSLARLPILSAFRYQRTGAMRPGLTLDAKRFADAGVLAAVADSAVATTLVTSEGRALTEVLLRVRNHAQKFLKVTLPPGATIVSVDVAGEPAKPALGADGTRVPLLRAGFHATGPYTVSFVYLHAGTPFARKGELEMTLPKMDMPVGIVGWEVFVPDNYSMRAIGGNVIDRRTPDLVLHSLSGSGGGVYRSGVAALPGQIRGRVTDVAGGVVPGATIAFDAGATHQTAVTDADGMFVVSGVPSGPVTMTAALSGFAVETSSFVFDQQPQQLDVVMALGPLSETVTVTGQTPGAAGAPKRDEAMKHVQPSQNVVNLQRRAAGVLPIRVDVPRAGTSLQFVKPLVVDQETIVSFRYKRR